MFKPVDRHGNIGEARITDRGVALVVKRRAELAGMDPREVSGHSLRAGSATSAASVGVQERVIAQTTGHKSMTLLLRRYIREGSVQRERDCSGWVVVVTVVIWDMLRARAHQVLKDLRCVLESVACACDHRRGLRRLWLKWRT